MQSTLVKFKYSLSDKKSHTKHLSFSYKQKHKLSHSFTLQGFFYEAIKTNRYYGFSKPRLKYPKSILCLTHK